MILKNYLQIDYLNKLRKHGLLVPRFSTLEPFILDKFFLGLKEEIIQDIQGLDRNDPINSGKKLEEIRKKIIELKVSDELTKRIIDQISFENNWSFLKNSFGLKILWPNEDDNNLSSRPTSDYLHFVKGEVALIYGIKGIVSSLFSIENIEKLSKFDFNFTILISCMINPKVSGEISTSSCKTNIPDAFDIKAAYGSGEIFEFEDGGYDEWLLDSDGGIIFNRNNLKKYAYQENQQHKGGAVLIELRDEVKLNPCLSEKDLSKLILIASKVEKALNVGPVHIDFVMKNNDFFITNVKKIQRFHYVKREEKKEIYFLRNGRQIFGNKVFPIEFSLFHLFMTGYLKKMERPPYIYFEGKILYKLKSLIELLFDRPSLVNTLLRDFGHQLKGYDLELKDKREIFFKNRKKRRSLQFWSYCKYLALTTIRFSMDVRQGKVFRKKIVTTANSMNKVPKNEITSTLSMINFRANYWGKVYQSFSQLKNVSLNLYKTPTQNEVRFEIFEDNLGKIVKFIFCDSNLSKIIKDFSPEEILNLLDENSDKSEHLKYLKYKLDELVQEIPFEQLENFSFRRELFYTEKISIIKKIKNFEGINLKPSYGKKSLGRKLEQQIKKISVEEYRKVHLFFRRLGDFFVEKKILLKFSDIYLFTIDELIEIIHQTSPLLGHLHEEAIWRFNQLENQKEEDALSPEKVEKIYHYGDFLRKEEAFLVLVEKNQ